MANTVSVEQAASDALCAWLASQLGGVKINDEWPNPDVAFLPTGEVTVLRAGATEEEAVRPIYVLKQVDDAYGPLSTFWFRTHNCAQPMQLDVWATSKPKRDDIVNRMGDALTAGKAQTLSPAFFAAEGIWQNQNPVEQSIALQLAAPYDFLIAAYEFEAPETTDSPDSAKRREFRASYRGTAYFDRVTSRRLPRLLSVQTSVLGSSDGVSGKTTTVTVTRTGRTLTRS